MDEEISADYALGMIDCSMFICKSHDIIFPEENSVRPIQEKKRKDENRCVRCLAKRSKTWAALNRGKRNLASKKYVENNPAKRKNTVDRYNKSNNHVKSLEIYKENNKDKCRVAAARYGWKKILGPDCENLIDRKLIEQKFICPITLVELPKTFEELAMNNRQRFAVDHCHTTGRFRGIITRKSNSAIGLFQDNIEDMERAIEYLKRNK